MRFYRPLGTEVLYALLNILGKSYVVGHIIAFAVFAGGVFFLFQIIRILTKDETLSKLAVILYVFHFSHVFQLYWLAAFQEVAMFAFLASSLYFALKKRWGAGLFLFGASLLSKEQVIVYPLFLFLLLVIVPLWKKKNFKKYFIGICVVTLVGFLVHSITIKAFATSPEYTLHFSPKLALNNWVWHFLWSLGFPSMMPDYFVSLFRPPLPIFWEFFNDTVFRYYFIFLAIFLLSFLFLFANVFRERKKRAALIRWGTWCIAGFTIFIIPILFIYHKWMIRLTLPLIFISLFEAYALSQFMQKGVLWRRFIYIVLAIYVITQYLGIIIHEEFSTYRLENTLTRNADRIFLKNGKDIQSRKILYISDTAGNRMSEWYGSKKLQITFANSSFLYYYLPGSTIRVFYGHEYPTVPRGAYVLSAEEFFR